MWRARCRMRGGLGAGGLLGRGVAFEAGAHFGGGGAMGLRMDAGGVLGEACGASRAGCEGEAWRGWTVGARGGISTGVHLGGGGAMGLRMDAGGALGALAVRRVQDARGRLGGSGLLGRGAGVCGGNALGQQGGAREAIVMRYTRNVGSVCIERTYWRRGRHGVAAGCGRGVGGRLRCVACGRWGAGCGGEIAWKRKGGRRAGASLGKEGGRQGRGAPVLTISALYGKFIME